MEHYDGPAFFRKFPVKPAPVKREDPIAERAASQVKQRQQRNTHEQRPTEPQAAAKNDYQHQQDTSQTAAQTPDNLNYRPFQVTEIPKQLHWSHRDATSRQRYQKLVARLHKADDSFFLFAAPGDVAPATPVMTVAPDSGSTDRVAVVTPAEPARPVEVFMPHPEALQQPVTPEATPVTTEDAQATTVKSETGDVASVSESVEHSTDERFVEPAPTEIFYPERPIDQDQATSAVGKNSEVTLAETVILNPEITPVDEPETEESGTGELKTEAPETNELKTKEPEAKEPEAEEAEAEEAEELKSEEPKPEEPKPEPEESKVETRGAVASQPASSPSIGVDYLPVGSASTPTPVNREGESSVSDTPQSGTSAATYQDGPQVDADVQRLLDRATSGEPLPVTEPAGDTAAAELSADAETTSPMVDPADAAAPHPSVDPTASVESSVADNPAVTTPPVAADPTPVVKAKPSRGLGHSLGDIMQEEGNDQRNLALFANPTVQAPVTPEPEEPIRGYHFPGLDLLPKPVVPDEKALDEWIEHQATVLDATLSAFHVDAHVTDWTIGPTVTQFQVKLALGVKVNKITNLNDDLKLALAAKDIRIEAPIPGKTTVGIEIPNKKSRPVMLSEILNSAAFKKSESPLTVALGVDLFGQPQVTDLRKMPHGLIAGATGSGKSVFINSLLLSILYKANPQQVKLLLIDPKAVEMAPYDGLPHLLSPVISDPKAAAAALKWVVTEMDQRYEKLAAAGVRNIEQFNDRADANDEPGLKMPYIVIIIDELADLMMMAASEVQDYIVRITQKARAAGIHLLVATQRPSVDIVTGTIKNNIPTRIAFMVSSQIDSRTILDTTGAESLLGRGDMLYLGNGASQPMRLQGAFVEAEVDKVTDFVRTQGKPRYAFEPNGLLKKETAEENQDELLPKVLEYIAQEKTVSTSKLQRVFSIGYNRAANLIDDLEQRNYVSPQHGSKPREVYLTPDDLGKQLPDPHDQSAPFSS